MPHRFRLVERKGGQTGVQFVYNSNVIFWSESYASKSGARNCVESVQRNAPEARVIDLTRNEGGSGYRFELVKSKDGQTYVRFVASNGETMMRTETYRSKSSARNAIRSLQTRGPSAEMMDEGA